eukprot:TRINITY_DN5694_c0_g2_i4.p1 TRINITY_DN5694_c0_g2~~TRINITY_DN5694_c0_g2_i4.p1  ORF type:complete len:258 (-),score=11.39 TRINITY_DN5694_c0_g2_i4:149-922(-)
MIVSQPLRAWVLATTFTAWLSIGSFIPFAKLYDWYYARAPGMRCQPDKTHSTIGLWSRKEVRLTVFNLAIAACLTTCIGISHIYRSQSGSLPHDKIYFDVPRHATDWAYILGSTVVFFLWIDIWAYLAHRALHFPALYRTVHKVHHTFKQPTAFSALALHPFDMLLLQGGIYVGLYVMPLHCSAVALNFLYIHYHNVIDHSGVYCESWFPWQPSSLYHDDHHRYFHCNYGQTLTLWDRLGGTLYSAKKTYSEKTFSW